MQLNLDAPTPPAAVTLENADRVSVAPVILNVGDLLTLREVPARVEKILSATANSMVVALRMADGSGQQRALKINCDRHGSPAIDADRFSEEARTLRKFSSPKAVQCFDIYAPKSCRLRGGITPNEKYCYELDEEVPLPRAMLLEKVEGCTLSQFRKIYGVESHKRVVLTYADALNVAIDLLGEVSLLHKAGLVHRDLKPSNIMCTPQGIRLIDFGLCREIGDGHLLPPGNLEGTPGFFSPEADCVPQLAISPPSDLFSVGAILYDLYCVGGKHEGMSPFTYSQFLQQLYYGNLSMPQHLAGNNFVQVITKLMCYDRDARYKSADEALEDLLILKRRPGVST